MFRSVQLDSIRKWAPRFAASCIVTCMGTPAMAQNFGEAVWFDGLNDQIVSTANFDTQNLTVEAWVNLLSLPQDSCGLVAWGRHSDASWEVGLADGEVAFAINWNRPNERRMLVTDAYSTLEWVHIATTYNGFTASIYINGELVDQRIFNMPIEPAGSGGFMALNSQFPGIDELGGALFDEVRIWSVARTQDQIRCSMSHEIDPNTPGLMAYYQFNTASSAGQNVVDSTGQRGAVLGGTSISAGDDPIFVASNAPFSCLYASDQPSDLLGGFGCAVEFSFQACGEGAMTYQWFHNGDLMPGANSAAVVVALLDAADAGIYSCLAINDCGSIVSSDAILDVCYADWDCSGMIDGDDLLEYFADWDQGDLRCDVDGSGGVDSDDVIVFIPGWENGC